MREGSHGPNILIFLVDQMPAAVIREDHPCLMPTVQALAREGVSLTNALTPSPHCCPSRATFMTGLYPSRHGIWNNVNTTTAHQANLNAGVQVLAEYLKPAGYHLAYAGKWHVSRDILPEDRGFVAYTEGERGLVRQDREGVAAQAHVPRSPGPRPEGFMFRPGWRDEPAYGERVQDKTFRGLWHENGVAPGKQALVDAATQGQPWCVVISTDMDYGNPVPEEVWSLYDGMEVELPASYEDDAHDKPRIYEKMRRMMWDQLTDTEAKETIRNCWARCTLQDQFFAEVLDTLERTGQEDDTLVLFVADHGDYVLSHGVCNMGIASYSEAYRIPAVMRWPRGIARPGREVQTFVTLADFVPTFLELAGVETDTRFSGRSLVPFLQDAEPPEDWPDHWCSQTKGNESYFTQRIVMTNRYKYVANWFDFDELYDLQEDPHELRNLAFPKPEDRRRPAGGCRAERETFVPWPPLEPGLDAVRRDLLRRMWAFAMREEDVVFNSYAPVALVPYGPTIAVD